MKCSDIDSKQHFEFPYDFKLQGIEIWLLRPVSTDANGGLKTSSINFENFSTTNSVIDITHSYFRNSPVYRLPGNLKFKKLREMILPENQLNCKLIGSLDNVEVMDSLTVQEYYNADQTQSYLNYKLESS